MKRYIILLLVIISPLLVLGQKYSNTERAQISNKIDSLLQKYMQKSALSEMPGLKKRNEKMFKEFKNLFTTDASIYDDMNATFDQQAAKDLNSGKSKDYPYKLETKTRNDYFDGLIDEFENGFVINNGKINANYDNFDNGIVKVALERQIEGTSFKGYKLQNNDTLLLTLLIKDKTVKISRIEAIGSHIKILNDKDLDGVIDTKDDCPIIYGKITLNGCPDKDDDGIPDKDDACPDISGPASNNGCPPSTFSYQLVFSGSAGYMMSKNIIEMPDYSQMGGYTNINKIMSNPGEIVNPKMSGGLGLNANIAYYIGKNKQTRNKGISIGISTISYKADYEINNAKYVFQAKDINGNKYSRIITLNKATENLTYNIINIPLLFKYKKRFGEKWAYEFSVGGSYILFRTKSSYDYNVSIEGRYSKDYTYSPTDNFTNSTDLVLTGSEINGKSGSPDVNILFNNQLKPKGYDLVYNQIVPNSSIQLQSRSGIALDAGADLFYHIKPKFALKLGLAYIYAPSIKNNKADDSTYKIIDSESKNPNGDLNITFKSIYDSSAKTTFTSYGLNLGIIIGLY